MRKTITISGKEYEMKANAHILWSYRREFGTELFDDASLVSDKLRKALDLPKEEQNFYIMSVWGDVTGKVLQMAYVMILEGDETFMPFEKWLKEVDDLTTDQNWLNEVLALATTFH